MVSYQKYKTKKGTKWLYQVYVENPVTGKSERITKRGFLKQTDAKAAFESFEEELKKGKNIFAKRLFEEVANEVLELQAKTCKESTMDSKQSKFKAQILPVFGKLQIDKITEEYCQKWIDDLEKQIGSARDYGIQANLVFKHAKRKKYIMNNPMEHIVYSKTLDENGEDDEKYDGFWNKDEVDRFISVAETNTELRNYVMFRVALYAGARKGEILALREEDLLPETKEIFIRKTLYWSKGEYKLLTPKTKKALRKIKLDDETWQLLQKLILSNKATRLAAGVTDTIEDKFVFVREEFRPMRLAYPNEVLTAMCKRFNFKNIKFHGLRHTHASMLFAAGARMKEVQERLGHARLDTTMNIYTHITEESKDDLQSKFMDYMTKKSDENAPEELIASKQHQKVKMT